MSDRRTVTEKRRAANQAAAQKSTGPTTPEGKQRAAFNSFQHGAFASRPHILESALEEAGSAASATLDTLRQQLLDDWQPATAQQALLVGDLAWLHWLRDQAARALVEGHERQRRRDELARDERRFNARHRTLSLCRGDYSNDGCVSLPDSEAKFAVAARLLDALEARLAKAAWKAKGEDDVTSIRLRTDLWGLSQTTLRGDKVGELWCACEEDKAGPKDPRVPEIRALLEEERAALAEEEALFRRRLEIDIEQPADQAFAGLHPLGEKWQSALAGIERLDRQINAKIRLLLRLQSKASGNDAPKTAAVPEKEPDPPTPAREHTPTEQVERTSASEVRGFLSGTHTEASDTEDGGAAPPAAGSSARIAGTKPSESLESTKVSIPRQSRGQRTTCP